MSKSKQQTTETPTINHKIDTANRYSHTVFQSQKWFLRKVQMSQIEGCLQPGRWGSKKLAKSDPPPQGVPISLSITHMYLCSAPESYQTCPIAKTALLTVDLQADSHHCDQWLSWYKLSTNYCPLPSHDQLLSIPRKFCCYLFYLRTFVGNSYQLLVCAQHQQLPCSIITLMFWYITLRSMTQHHKPDLKVAYLKSTYERF